MVTHDQMIFAILQVYPHLRHGLDFWVGHEVDGDVQISPARIYQWGVEDIPEPSEAELEAWVAEHSPAYFEHEAAYQVRLKRDRLLAESDVLWMRAQESGQDTTALSAYRQALRDVPQQPGFPHDIDWPEMP